MQAATEPTIYAVHRTQRLRTWRPEPLDLTYLYLSGDPTPEQLVSAYRLALDQGLPNPRAIPPRYLAWSEVFNPRFHRATLRAGLVPDPGSRMRLARPRGMDDPDQLTRFWLQSVLFLASVTLSAAVVQSRWGPGTLASKYDRLWQAGELAAAGVIPELAGLDVRAAVRGLVARPDLPPVDRLLGVRALFEQAVALLAAGVSSDRRTIRAERLPAHLRDRFGFVTDLRRELGSDLRCVLVYGSSVTSTSYADIDAVLISDRPERTLRTLAGTNPQHRGTELNISVYSAAELWSMQLLSGDNLHDYGLCIYGEAEVPEKPRDFLLARNLSFGMVRQRQQLGMVAATLAAPPERAEPGDNLGDDRRNLYEYFVKIPANVVKGTWGVVGRQQPKSYVQAWLETRCGFDTALHQLEATAGRPAYALAAAALATADAMVLLNEELGVVDAAARMPEEGAR